MTILVPFASNVHNSGNFKAPKTDINKKFSLVKANFVAILANIVGGCLPLCRGDRAYNRANNENTTTSKMALLHIAP